MMRVKVRRVTVRIDTQTQWAKMAFYKTLEESYR
jgi:hypothetical protein